MITHAQLSTMLALQEGLNVKINPNWKLAGYAWHRAIMVEAVELLEHVGWKWWKAQEPNVAQARLELVDIWHFAMSLAMVQQSTDQLLETPEVLNLPIKLTVDALIHDAAREQFNYGAFCDLMAFFGMTWDDLYRIYVGKNVLNTFRQNHGYKEGTYRKDWGGVEDNVVLDQITDMNFSITPERLYEALECYYSQLK